MNSMTPTSHERESSNSGLGTVFHTLSHSTRRRILTAIDERNPREGDEFKPENIAGAEEKQLLHHWHLPNLDEAGFIDWDREAGTITTGPRYEEIGMIIRMMRDCQDELPHEWP